MTDLFSLLPNFSPSNPSTSRLLSLLESAGITTSDLLTLDALDISRRCSAGILEIKRFVKEISTALHNDIEALSAEAAHERECFITTGDDAIDDLLGGGVPVGALTECVGESAVGKTQLLVALTLMVQLPPSLGGLSRPAVYISTEARLSTPRLVEIASCLKARYPEVEISTDRVFSINCGDLEAQDHILRYQLPVVVERYNVGLIVIDSIAANFRAEFDRSSPARKRTKTMNGGAPADMARRGGELVDVAQGLRDLARKHSLAVVVANQVSDRFEREERVEDDIMGLDFQGRWFTGWDRGDQSKVPALGLVWANLLSARVVMRFRDAGGGGKRQIGVVFSGWTESGKELDYEIRREGIRAVRPED